MKSFMQIIKGLDTTFNFQNPVVTIGNFDGVHIGHQKIFQKIAAVAKQIAGTSVAISFNPHPVKVLTPERGLKMITTLDDKAELLSQSGLNALIIIPFDKKFSQIEPDSFIKDILIDRIGIKWLIVGHNFCFGKKKKGNIKLLRQKAGKYGFGFSVVRYAKKEGKIVSSSKIRSLIQRGNVAEAAKMLGRAYHIKGRVIKGTGRGSAILNIPTANIKPANEILPKEGVYAVKVSFCSTSKYLNTKNETLHPDKNSIKYEVFNGAANIGTNPTFGDITNISLEVHLLDFEKNLLDKELCIHFIQRIRDEKRFSTIKELQKQITEDIEKARQIFRMKSPKIFGLNHL